MREKQTTNLGVGGSNPSGRANYAADIAPDYFSIGFSAQGAVVK
jgi:hypothetical protein